MHAAAGPVRGSQTAGSLVCRLDPRGAACFATGTAAPCLSLYKPVWVDAGLPDTGPEPSGTWSEAALYWRHEQFHRTVLGDYAARAAVCAGEQEALERRFVESALERAGAPPAERLALSRKCFAEADEALRRWTERAAAVPVQKSGRPKALYAAAWRAHDRKAGMPARA